MLRKGVRVAVGRGIRCPSLRRGCCRLGPGVARDGAELRRPRRLDGHQHRPERDHGESGGQPRVGGDGLSLQESVTGTIHAADAVAASGAERSSPPITMRSPVQPCTAGSDGTGPGSAGVAHPRGLLFFLVGSVDRHPDAQRAGECRGHLHFQDREHADDRKRIVCAPDQRREPVRRGLADRQLRDTRNDHVVHRQPDRADAASP